MATLGLVNMDDDTATIETGERIEDQDYYQNKTSRIHWNSHHKLVLPDFYYISCSSTSPNSSQEQSNEATSSSDLSFQTPQDKISLSPPNYSVDAEHLKQSNNEVEETCSISSDNNQLLLPLYDPTQYYMPVLRLQLCSGEWVPQHSLATAIGVSLDIISELSVSNEHLSVNSFDSGRFWATALALAFLDIHFSHLKTEWHLMAHKAHQWLDKNECVPDVHSTAKRVVSQSM